MPCPHTNTPHVKKRKDQLESVSQEKKSPNLNKIHAVPMYQIVPNSTIHNFKIELSRIPHVIGPCSSWLKGMAEYYGPCCRFFGVQSWRTADGRYRRHCRVGSDQLI